MIDLNIRHFFCSGVYAKQMTLPKGHFAISHRHAYDHISILASGVALVMANGVETEYKAPACVEIKAGVEHKITALEDATWFCIHKTDETDTDKVDRVLIEGN